MEWSLMGFKVKSRYRVDASISGGCVRVILKERQCSPFSVIQDRSEPEQRIQPRGCMNGVRVCEGGDMSTQ